MSLAVHGVILFLLLRHGPEWLAGGGGATGPRGGGGGGSPAAVRYAELPAVPAPAQQVAAPVLEPPVPEPQVSTPIPTPRLTDPAVLPELTVAARPALTVTAAVSGTGTGAGAGAGPGTGGGIGSGVGTGVGNDSGPGRGGGGEYISPPYARTVLLPPECARGRFTVQFWVEADGHVSRVAIDPLPKDAGCRRDMREKMKGYQFLPARTRDGRAVARVYQVQLQH